jgi:hypothetical protein
MRWLSNGDFTRMWHALGAVVSMCGPATCSLQGLYTLSAPDGQLNQVSDAVRTGSM